MLLDGFMECAHFDGSINGTQLINRIVNKKYTQTAQKCEESKGNKEELTFLRLFISGVRTYIFL